MSSTHDAIAAGFGTMGARIKLIDAAAPFSIDIRRDAEGEYFELAVGEDVTAVVADVRDEDRHLLLLVDTPATRDSDQMSAYLCGHDERHWFVAAIPEKADAWDVQAAKDALKPNAVWEAMREYQVPPEHRDRRRTAAFIRQGEWFFIPRPLLRLQGGPVLKNEPIQRGAGKPHRCQFLYRPQESGEFVWVNEDHPNGLTDAEYYRLSKADRRKLGWRRTVRNARVYVKGNIRHPDHKTLWLSEWHQVVMNTETESQAMADMAFVD